MLPLFRPIRLAPTPTATIPTITPTTTEYVMVRNVAFGSHSVPSKHDGYRASQNGRRVPTLKRMYDSPKRPRPCHMADFGGVGGDDDSCGGEGMVVAVPPLPKPPRSPYLSLSWSPPRYDGGGVDECPRIVPPISARPPPPPPLPLEGGDDGEEGGGEAGPR